MLLLVGELQLFVNLLSLLLLSLNITRQLVDTSKKRVNTPG